MKKAVKLGLCIIPLLMLSAVTTMIYSILNIGYTMISAKILSSTAEYFVRVISFAAAGLVLYLYRRMVTGPERKGEGEKTVFGTGLGISVLAIGTGFFISGIMTLVYPLFQSLFAEYWSVVESIESGSWYMVLIYVVVVAPVVEELLFRGIILREAENILSFFWANIFQAILFGIYHGNIVQGMFTALVGLLLGILCQRYRSLWAPILFHMVFNGSTYLIRILPGGVGTVVFLISMGTFLSIPSLYLVVYKKTVSVE